MRFVPNMLSLSRIPISGVLLWGAVVDAWILVAVMMMLGLLTDALDGAIARRYGLQTALGGDVLEPACDMVLCSAAVAALYLGGIWPLWVPVALLVLTALLQVSHSTPFTRLKRHTFWIHPIFFVTVVFFAGLAIVDVAFHSPVLVLVYGIVWGVIGMAKKDRWMHWFNGPPATTVS